MDPCAELRALEEIRQLVARRVHAVDRQDWVAYRACHADGAVSHALGATGDGTPVVGADAMTEAVRRALSGRTSVHTVHSPVLVLTSPTTASGTWSMEDRLWWEQDGRDYRLHGWGWYDEEYALRQGCWLVTSRRLTRTRIERTPAT